MAKITFWSRLFGGDAGNARASDPSRSAADSHVSASLLQHILNLAGQDRAAPAVAARTVVTPAGDIDLDPFISPAITFAAVPRDAVAAAPTAQAVQGPAGPFTFDVEGGGPTVAVLVDWPWPLAHGLAPITADSGTTAKKEPIGWLENYLAVTALGSPLQVDFTPEEFNGTGPSSLDWAGEARTMIGLSGDFSAGFTFGASALDVSWVVLSEGYDYNLAANDNFVAAGANLVIDASALGDDDEVRFIASGETDGRYTFIGGGGDDLFFGGAGGDRIDGGDGGDTLAGGGGGDVFVYRAAADSSSADYDTITDFNPAADRIDLPGTVSGFGAAVTAGALSTATFDSDLGAAVGNLGASQAVWFAPDAGDLAGRVFLVVDGNGRAGYQAGEDFVIAIGGAPLAHLTGHTDIFI